MVSELVKALWSVAKLFFHEVRGTKLHKVEGQ